MFRFLGMFNDEVSADGASVICTIRKVRYHVNREHVSRINSNRIPVSERTAPLYTSLLRDYIRSRGSVYR